MKIMLRMAGGVACASLLLCGPLYGAGPTEYVHVEHIGGGVHRVDQVEYVSGDDLITCYYAYEDAARPLYVTTIDVYRGSRYVSPDMLCRIRYTYRAMAGRGRGRYADVRPEDVERVVYYAGDGRSPGDRIETYYLNGAITRALRYNGGVIQEMNPRATGALVQCVDGKHCIDGSALSGWARFAVNDIAAASLGAVNAVR